MNRIYQYVLLCGVMFCSGQATTLFNGSDLDSWTVLGNGSWTVQDGAIKAVLSRNEAQFAHLVYDSLFRDFRVSFLFRSVRGNAGFFYRMSQKSPGPDGVTGVQSVIDPNLNAPDAFGLYETNGRGWVQRWDYNKWKDIVKQGEWNRISIIAEGNRIILKLNMHAIVDINDEQGNREGKFAFKLHGGQDVETWFKDVKVEPIPKPNPGPFLSSRLKKALLFNSPTSPAPAREYLKQLADENSFIIDEGDASAFTAQNLAQYQVALFISDYNITFNQAQKIDFENWFREGNGAVCVHACSRQEIKNDWPWWAEALGSTLQNHTDIKKGTVRIDPDAEDHEILDGLDREPLSWTDEWFYFQTNPREKEDVTVLLTTDEQIFMPDHDQWDDYPHAWVNAGEGGRFFFWAGLHTMEALEQPFIYDFLANTFRYLAGYDTVKTGCTDPSYLEYNEFATEHVQSECRTLDAVDPNRAVPKKIIAVGKKIRITYAGRHSVRVFDTSGKEVFKVTGTGPSEHLLPYRIRTGMYFIHLIMNDTDILKRIMVFREE